MVLQSQRALMSKAWKAMSRGPMEQLEVLVSLTGIADRILQIMISISLSIVLATWNVLHTQHLHSSCTWVIPVEFPQKAFIFNWSSCCLERNGFIASDTWSGQPFLVWWSTLLNRGSLCVGCWTAFEVTGKASIWQMLKTLASCVYSGLLWKATSPSTFPWLWVALNSMS